MTKPLSNMITGLWSLTGMLTTFTPQPNCVPRTQFMTFSHLMHVIGPEWRTSWFGQCIEHCGSCKSSPWGHLAQSWDDLLNLWWCCQMQQLPSPPSTFLAFWHPRVLMPLRTHLHQKNPVFSFYTFLYFFLLLCKNVTLQVGRAVRRGHVRFTEATTKVLGFWMVCRGQGPTTRQGRH